MPKTLLLLLIGILRDIAAARKDLVEEVTVFLTNIIKTKDIPLTKNIEKQ